MGKKAFGEKKHIMILFHLIVLLPITRMKTGTYTEYFEPSQVLVDTVINQKILYKITKMNLSVLKHENK